jgi:hypothetical protein
MEMLRQRTAVEGIVGWVVVVQVAFLKSYSSSCWIVLFLEQLPLPAVTLEQQQQQPVKKLPLHIEEQRKSNPAVPLSSGR